MTHSSHPYGFRVGIVRDWRSHWFSSDKKKFSAFLREDYLIRTFLDKELEGNMVSNVELDRSKDGIGILIKTARPGLIIGSEGSGIDLLINKIKKFARKNRISDNIKIKVEEVRFAEQDASLVADSIVHALKKRSQHRRLMKQTVEKVMANRNVKGCRILIAGRLGGAEIARREEVKRGNIPLQTIKADIDYAHREAVLSYGTLGIKVWIYKGEIEDNK